ncbi:MAG: ribonuclease HII [Anaerolineales bacterium]
MRARIDPNLIPAAPNFEFERGLWEAGIRFVAGIDEAGRGALAGPVAVGVVIFSPGESLHASLQGLRDSKQMTPAQRAKWAILLQDFALAWGVAFAAHDEIDRLGIVPATQLAAERALKECTCQADHLLLDYLFLPDSDIPQTKLVKGDQRSLSVAGASVLAKTSRDAHMNVLDQKFPGYLFAEHKGYGTLQHFAALERLGPSPIHRTSFAPVKNLLFNQ